MKTKLTLTILTFILSLVLKSQEGTYTLAITGIDNASYVQLDSIKVMNRSQEGDTVLYWPDTLLALDYQNTINIDIGKNESFRIFPSYPNPVILSTTISLYIPSEDNVDVVISDALGRSVATSNYLLGNGYHSFVFEPGNGRLFFFTARWKQTSASIKILSSSSNTNGNASLDYLGNENNFKDYKSTYDISQNFTYEFGDTLLFIGYTDTMQSGLLDIPESNKTYSVQFATNIPCPGSPTVSYEGQEYNTIQIFGQCWLKENLNVGTMIQGEEFMTDNEIIEKYCYDNEPDSCTRYGGLYQWWEMMQYTTQQGVQGICPPGWHLPTDEEWKILEGSADSHSGIGDILWDDDGYRGFDVGINLKATNYWYGINNGTDLYGFYGLPGGRRYSYSENFSALSHNGLWWTSTEFISGTACCRNIENSFSGIAKSNFAYTELGFSVRCLKN